MNFNPRSAVLAIALFASTAALTPVYAETHQQSTSKIIAAYGAFDAAVAKKDASGAVASDAPDYVGYDEKGKTEVKSKADDLAQAEQALPMTSKCTSKSVVTKIVYDKTGATVFETQDQTFTFSAGGQEHTGSVHSTCKELWVESHGTWLRKTSWTISETSTTDGKPDAG
jgi:ketosteroid isomerase-like protein